jgi:hypothetical protein
MKHFAEGFQYKVYSIENNRVFKKAHPYLITFFKVFVITRKRKFSILKSFLTAFSSDKENKRALQTMREKLKDMPLHLFANPKFTGESLNFTQDKVIVLEDYLKQNKIEDIKKILDEYATFQKILWSHGIHDAVYKFQPNYGVDKNGTVVCIDFGEFVFTKQRALESIKKEKWFSRPSYKKWEDSEIKKYYTEMMKELMTPENLEKNWRDF